MNAADKIADALREIAKPLSKGYTWCEKEYRYADPDLPFKKWLSMVAEMCQEHNKDIRLWLDTGKRGLKLKDVMKKDEEFEEFFHCWEILNILVGLCDEKELNQFVEQANLQDKLDDFCFDAGLYESVPSTSQFAEKAALCKQFNKMGIVGNSPEMISLFHEIHSICAGIRKYPDSLPNILVWGDTGTGKELVAKAISQLSGRTGEFRAVNCASFPSDLLESELFGCEPGAYTNAPPKGKKGLLEICSGGTFQLDEINKMPPYLQHKLLRALQEREIRHVGGTNTIPIDVLFIATTNENLQELVKTGNFARDLYDRLTGEVVEVPALQRRSADILLLVKHFLKNFPDNPLYRYRFPLAVRCQREVDQNKFNVRQLKNFIENRVRRWVDQEEIRGVDSTQPGKNKDYLERKEAIQRAIEAVSRQEQSQKPLTKAQLARQIQWKGKKGGIHRSNFNRESWRSVVAEFEAQGKIK